MNGLALFSGIGGLSLGLSIACPDFRDICHVERESAAAAVLAAQMESGILAPAAIWDDIASFDGRRWRGLVDILHGGFPCQPFSVAGSRKGTSDDRWLWDHIARIIDETEVPLVFLENVGGLISTLTIFHVREFREYFRAVESAIGQADAREGWYLASHANRLHRRLLASHGISVLLYITCELESRGFRVESGLFSASECGAPQKRERLFILGYRKDFAWAKSSSAMEPSQSSTTICSQNSADGNGGNTKTDMPIEQSGIRQIQRSGAISISTDSLCDRQMVSRSIISTESNSTIGESISGMWRGFSTATIEKQGQTIRRDIVESRDRRGEIVIPSVSISSEHFTGLEASKLWRRRLQQEIQRWKQRESFNNGDLANPSNGLLPQPRRGSQGRDGTGPAESPLEHSERPRWPETGDRRQEHAGDESEPGCGTMAHASDPRLQGRELGRTRDGNGGGQETHGSTAELRDARLPLWPPGPGDAAGWRYVLERWPELAPAVADAISIDDDRAGSATGNVRRERSRSTEIQGCELEDSARIREHGQDREDSGSGGRDGEASGELADASSSGLRTSGSIQESTYAPQSDEIIEQETEHEVRGLADELPAELPRTDQLRAYGNAVVPICGSKAFVVLAQRAGLGEWINGEFRFGKVVL